MDDEIRPLGPGWHVVKIEQTPGGTRWRVVCRCGYRSGTRNSQPAAAATAENHLKGLAG